jgi:hypothetical protein
MLKKDKFIFQHLKIDKITISIIKKPSNFHEIVAKKGKQIKQQD